MTNPSTPPVFHRSRQGLVWIVGFFFLALALLNADRQDNNYDGKGVGEILQILQKLASIASVLHIGAHPDDEDSGLLAYLARAQHARTAYLSLTRGDGGQNLIGPELYEALGVIRTEELLAARQIDGAQQFFSQAYDFGFSKSAEESLRKWGHEATLGDMVRIIRLVRPLVVISRFSGRTADGHGQHQAAGVLTAEAFRAAADPQRFPEHLAEGLRPWSAKKMYRHTREGEATLRIQTGEYNPLVGGSFYQVGIQGRSLHRSQGQATVAQKGPHWSYLLLLHPQGDSARREPSIFEGMDTRLRGMAAWAGQEADRVPFLVPELNAVELTVEQAIKGFKPLAPHEAAEPILRGLQRLRALRARLEQSPLSRDVQYEILFLIDQKIGDFIRGANATLGLTLETLSGRPRLIPGESTSVSLQILNRSPISVTPLVADVGTPDRWTTSAVHAPLKPIGYNESLKATLTLTPPADAPYTQPYWLRWPRHGDRFAGPTQGSGGDLDQRAPKPRNETTGQVPLRNRAEQRMGPLPFDERGLPFSPPEVVGRVRYQAYGVECVIEQPLQFRSADPSLGEIRRPVPVVPPIAVSLTPEMLALPIKPSAQEKTFEVTVTHQGLRKTEGKVRVVAPPSWRVEPSTHSFNFEREGEKRTLRFQLRIPAGVTGGEYKVGAQAELEGKTYDLGYRIISYPHITPRHLFRPATASVQALDVMVAHDLTVGYVMGTGDEIPQAIEQIGVPVTLLTAEALGAGNLRNYSTIVIGIRAYSAREDLRSYHARLMDYVRAGGLLLVQYQRTEFPAPYRLSQGRSVARVANEEAPVRILEPDHPLFHFPNRITGRDFDGWVQERGAYFMTEWETPFRPLLACHDPGEPPQSGGLLIAPYGQGMYIFTGYAWFRQLPAGVPGAYRLFANLISLAKAPKSQM